MLLDFQLKVPTLCFWYIHGKPMDKKDLSILLHFSLKCFTAQVMLSQMEYESKVKTDRSPTP